MSIIETIETIEEKEPMKELIQNMKVIIINDQVIEAIRIIIETMTTQLNKKIRFKSYTTWRIKSRKNNLSII